MNVVDLFLNRHTPYSLVLRGLWVLVLISFVESVVGLLPYTPIQLFFSLIILLAIARISDAFCTLITGAISTRSSTTITALLLFFIVSAPQSAGDAVVLMLAAAVAIFSKYVFSTRNLHVFNPAAFGALIIGLAVPAIVTWWIGNLMLLPFVAVLGFLLLRKVQRAEQAVGFLVAAVLIVCARTILLYGFSVSAVEQGLIGLIVSSPLLFVGMIMLADPHTMPHIPRVNARYWYGGIVGLLYPLSYTFWGLSMSPQLAVCIGNLVGYSTDSLARVRHRMMLSLHKVTKLSRDTFEFFLLPAAYASEATAEPSFIDPQILSFLPGQSLEITLPHPQADYRGIRRTFVLTSSPEDHYLSFCTTIPVECSTFKETLHILQRSLLQKEVPEKKLVMSATGPHGDFIFPEDPSKKLFFLASGIGIASFMSYLRQLAERRERRDIVLLYSATSPLDFIFREEIDSYKDRIGLVVEYVPLDFVELGGKWQGISGPLTAKLVQDHVAKFEARCWYVAGPQFTVEQYKKIAETLHVPASSLKMQQYPGF